MAASSQRRVLVYGGKGALGNACVQLFVQHNYVVDSIDLVANGTAHGNVVVTDTPKWEEQADAVTAEVGKLVGDAKYDAVLCMAGGWQGGSASSDAFIRSCDAMWRQSVWSSVIAARIASRFLAADGTLVLVGANAAFDATPGMIGYGMAKAAVHQLARSLAADKGGLPPNAFVAALSPVTLDTPANRTAMPGADTSSWTPLDVIAVRVREWVEGRERPASGSLVRVVTHAGCTDFTPSQ